MKNAPAIAVIGGMLVIVACHAPPELPEVSKPVASLDGDDRAVMKAVLDGYLRPERDQLIQRGMGVPKPVVPTPTFLMFDATIVVCDGQDERGVQPGCIDSRWSYYLGSVTSGPSLSAIQAFNGRNTRSLPLRDMLADDVVYIPIGIGSEDFQALMRKYSSPHVVALSAPVYLEARSAVVAYRYFWHSMGFVALQRSNGGWKVATHSGSVE